VKESGEKVGNLGKLLKKLAPLYTNWRNLSERRGGIRKDLRGEEEWKEGG